MSSSISVISNVKIILKKMKVLTDTQHISKNELLQYLYIPIEISNSEDFNNIIENISNKLDLNNDGSYDYHDINYLLEELNKQNLGIFLSLISVCSDLLKLVTFLNSNLEIKQSNIVDLVFKLIVFFILIPLANNENFNNWANESYNNTNNLDHLLTLFENIRIILITSTTVQNIINSILLNTKSIFAFCLPYSEDTNIKILNDNMITHIIKIDSKINKHINIKKIKKELDIIKNENKQLKELFERNNL
jgi:hypothetical protein